ncbi:hypothetical protein LENED_008803 [Lentinula edodes]|uniref:Uncharacterized protein n=1 Tax=Lentinula edodes TaxID=5353 RepID=A0A1Q3EI30_LENED|nr:hypothetical protein LENED_008803 [Lentinula edodes]
MPFGVLVGYFCMHTSSSFFFSLYLLRQLLRRFHDGTSPYVLLACHRLPLHGPIFSLFIIAHSVFIGSN